LSLTGLIFLGGFLVGCLLALTRHPIFGLITYVGTFFLHPPSRWWGQGLLLPIRWSLISAAVALLAVLIHRNKLAPAPPFRQSGIAIAFFIFIAWLGLQSFWALDPEAHNELFSYYAKFALALFLFYRCIDSEQHLRYFLWAHVLGCFYFGLIAFTSYEGGRFEDFGGPGLAEANAGALTIVTGILAASALFLGGTLREKWGLFGVIPFIVNGLVTTISRSGFLAAGVGGILFNLFTPKTFRKRVRILSALALVMFGILTGPMYWERIQSIQQLGSEVEGVDTGSGRLVIMKVQLRMFASYPAGCGATCTAVLSPLYLDDSHLTGEGEQRARASHNTFLTMLVEHGLPGAVFYVFMALWIARSVRTVSRRVDGQSGFLACALPAVAGILGAMFVSDMFATYAKFEVRIWFIAVLMAMLHMSAKEQQAQVETERAPAKQDKPPLRRAARVRHPGS
jgi:hypothetical protein